ncbi:MAG: hypothetical protein IPF92_05790 [Myxococcales bacterium]|nr:hypothetical protein [Myxococcales bacterium]HQY61587.1 hypothetical protein [Polyangiaceae bacterium]
MGPYVAAFRAEPKLRAFAFANFVDDLGVAVAAWAAMLIMTNLFTSQRERASLMLPSLGCFLLGTIVSGPLADWAARFSWARLARFRFRLVVWARLVEGAALLFLLVRLTSGAPTVRGILPFVMLSAFTKTAFRPTRIVFSVDLLREQSVQTDETGAPLKDERGEPLLQKTHLLTMTSVIGGLQALATFGGLLLGGRILALAAGRYAPLIAVQAVMHLAFAGLLFFFCHPTRAARDVRLRELFVDVPGEDDAAAGGNGAPAARLTPLGAVAHFGRSLGQGLRFLFGKERRPLLALLAGTAVVEFVTESYDGKMLIKHVLHGTDDAVRHAEIAWSIVGVLGVLAVPALARKAGSLGKIFVVTMLVDGLVIAAAGRVAAAAAPSAVLPFTAILALDHSLTLASGSLAELAQNSASSPGMRGRIAGVYAFFVIIGDIVVEGVATEVSEAIGLPAMLTRVGLFQVGLVLVLVLVGGRRLVRFGLREADDGAVPGEART